MLVYALSCPMMKLVPGASDCKSAMHINASWSALDSATVCVSSHNRGDRDRRGVKRPSRKRDGLWRCGAYVRIKDGYSGRQPARPMVLACNRVVRRPARDWRYWRFPWRWIER